MDPQNRKILFKKTFSSSRNNRKLILDEIINALAEGHTAPDQDGKTIYLTIDEALTNAMEHGNQWNADKHVHIRVESIGDDIKISIEDEGNGFNPAPFVVNEQPGGTSKRGRGIRLIRQFSTPQWNSKGNCIELTVTTRK